jgi:hypothetical protein
LVNPLSVKYRSKFEVETVVVAKGKENGGISNPTAERTKVNIIVDKSNRALMEIEKLEPTRIKIPKHATTKSPEHKDVKKIRVMDDMVYTYDKSNELIGSSASSMKTQMNEMIDLVSMYEGTTNFLKPAIQYMDEKQLAVIAERKNLKMLDASGGSYKLGKVKSIYNAQSRGNDQMEFIEYYDKETGLIKGNEAFKNGQVVLRAAFFYEIGDTEAELKQIHSVSYYYDMEGNLEEEKISNTFFTSL